METVIKRCAWYCEAEDIGALFCNILVMVLK
jgi:hypothetical protein